MVKGRIFKTDKVLKDVTDSRLYSTNFLHQPVSFGVNTFKLSIRFEHYDDLMAASQELLYLMPYKYHFNSYL
jgi:hypothetical protein